MKKLLFFISSFLLLLNLSCKQEQATNVLPINKYKILNDSNWVEVIDTIHIDLGGKNSKGILMNPPMFLRYNILYSINDTSEYQGLKYELDSIGILTPNPPLINFEQRTLLGYYLIFGNHFSTSRLLKNKSTNVYAFIIDIKLIDDTDVPYNVREWLLVPKIEYNYQVIVDTLCHY